MADLRNKSNKKFMLLSAVGIFMVVDHHTFTAFNFFGDFIPYNSFFMPMFVFISGYFNKIDDSTKLWSYTKKKLKNLLLPYLVISLAVFGLQWLIELFKTGEAPSYPSGYLTYILERVITIGAPFPLVEPMWFVITLFTALMIYAIAKKLLFKIWNSYVMFGIFTALSILAVYIGKTADPEAISWYLLPLKVMFIMPFLELGIIYRDHLEGKHAQIPAGGKIMLMFGLLIFNLIRTLYLPQAYDVAFDSIDDMSGFTSPYLVTPLISSLVGILFWLTFVDLVAKPVGDSRFINYMSCNTFVIMGFHIVFFNILNCIMLFISEHLVEIPYFDAEAFRGTEWYYWEISSSAKIIYVAAGILGPLGIKWIFDKVYRKVKSIK